MFRIWAICGSASVIACASMMSGGGQAAADRDQYVRIALASSAESASVSATGEWRLLERSSERIIATERTGGTWVLRKSAGGIRLFHGGASNGATRNGPLIVRSTENGSFVTFNGKRYRGELAISAGDSGLVVVNRLSLESYLRGVVPLEIGNRTTQEAAAVEAQAVAARSYSYLHFSPARAFDMYATVQDQVYGGMDAEKPVADAAIAATRGMVLKFAGRVVNTPYHSTCGGSTAAVHEVWYKEPDQPYLRSVSDRIPGTDSFYCDPSPRFRWTRTFDSAALRAVMEKYLANYTSAPAGQLGRIRAIRENGRTESDRVASLVVETDRGQYTLRGNDIRFVLRSPSGEILNNTYFKSETRSNGGEIEQLTVTGRGYGHGIGMCQWGAIGRARAGQDYRTILAAYYPGTTIGQGQ